MRKNIINIICKLINSYFRLFALFFALLLLTFLFYLFFFVLVFSCRIYKIQIIHLSLFLRYNKEVEEKLECASYHVKITRAELSIMWRTFSKLMCLSRFRVIQRRWLSFSFILSSSLTFPFILLFYTFTENLLFRTYIYICIYFSFCCSPPKKENM